MRRLTRTLRRARVLLPAALLVMGACGERVTGPQAIEQAMKLERDVAAGRASVSTYAVMFAPLKQNGDAAPLRVIVDGVETEYWAFVFDRDYLPSRGNDPNGAFDRRRADMILWRPDEPNDYFIMQAGVARASFRPFKGTEDWMGPEPRPWISHGMDWLSTSGEGEIARLQDSVATCDGLIDAATDRPARHGFEYYHGPGFMPDDFGPDPRISCARARFIVSATAVLQQGIWGPNPDKNAIGGVVTGFKPAERRVVIPPQTALGTRLVVECNGTRQSAEVGCGPQTRPMPPEVGVARPAAAASHP